MKGLSREELLKLTNAEYGFRESELIQLLQGLEGDWVIDELRRLATGEPDDLVRATLTVGLFGGFRPSRMTDPRLLAAARDLIPLYVTGEADPFGAAASLTMGTHAACMRQKQDLGQLLLPHLGHSDNPDLLLNGYLMLGNYAGTESALSDAMLRHANDEGRFGALEGLRFAATKGRVSADDITRLGREALATEHSARNRLLLVEMIGAMGGDAGLDVLSDIVKSGDSDLLGEAATTLAHRGDPERALATISSALQNSAVSEADRASLYQALGVIQSPETKQRLLDVAHDTALSDTERLQGLRGLWHRTVDEELATELRGIIDSNAPAEMRAESLRMLAMNSETMPELDVLTLAAADEDDAVRREAVLLGALQGGPDTRAWLEERLLNDRSPDVKAAALSAMVVQAHYGGDGETALDYLSRARRMTEDPAVIDLIDRGETMARSYDPRRLDIQLQEQAETYKTIAKYVKGPSQLEFQRQARYMDALMRSIRANQPR